MPVEIKEIVVKTQIDNNQRKSGDCMSSDELNETLESFKQEIMNEVMQAMSNQITKNQER